MQSRKLEKVPENDARSSLHSARNAATASSVRAARSAKGTPTASNSSSSHPTPMPRRTRPPESASSVASSLASTTGLRWGRISTPVASLTVVVAAGRYASHTRGSGTGESSLPGIRPDGSYG
jgi:hypothetical protein